MSKESFVGGFEATAGRFQANFIDIERSWCRLQLAGHVARVVAKVEGKGSKRTRIYSSKAAHPPNARFRWEADVGVATASIAEIA